MRYKTLFIMAGLILLMWSFVAFGTALEEDRIELSQQSEEVSAEIVDTNVVQSDNTHPDIYDIKSTYKYEYNGEEYTTEFSTSYRQTTTARRVNDKHNIKRFSERLENKAENMEGSEEYLYINSDNPSDAERSSTDNFVSNLTWGLGVIIWIPILVWFCRSFANDILN